MRPTVFANVTNDMTIAREEIFGPVLSIIGYKDEDDAVRIANDTPYGLAGYVSSGDVERARRVARRIRAGNVNMNGAPIEMAAPFGGYKQSGNGREWGRFGLEEYLEVKAVAGWGGVTRLTAFVSDDDRRLALVFLLQGRRRDVRCPPHGLLPLPCGRGLG